MVTAAPPHAQGRGRRDRIVSRLLNHWRTAMTEQDALIEATVSFIEKIKDKTPGEDMERWLNATHGPGSKTYEELAALVKRGVDAGWAANAEIAGPHYRRSRLLEPCERSRYFSLTTVYMDSRGGKLPTDAVS